MHEDVADKRMRIFTYELQDLFTKVPRGPFLEMLRKPRTKAREENARYNYF